jgi:hypothetical protein
MTNGKRTLTERMTVIETKFETVIEPMAFKVNQIHDALPEIVRKVNAHHCVFPDHVETIEMIKKKILPEPRLSDGNGGYQERRIRKSWRRQWQEAPLYRKVTIIIISIPLVILYFNPVVDKIQAGLELLQELLK